MPNTHVLRIWLPGLLFQAIAAHARHSAAAAFKNNIIEVEGYVVEFNFTNPHVNIVFDVTNEDGESVRWTATNSAANLLRRRGWTFFLVALGRRHMGRGL